jgi:hypothetical protein
MEPAAAGGLVTGLELLYAYSSDSLNCTMVNMNVHVAFPGKLGAVMVVNHVGNLRRQQQQQQREC